MMISVAIAVFALTLSVIALLQNRERDHEVEVLHGRLYESEQALTRYRKSINILSNEMSEVQRDLIVLKKPQPLTKIDSSAHPEPFKTERHSSNLNRESISEDKISKPQHRILTDDVGNVYIPHTFLSNDNNSLASDIQETNRSSSYDSGYTSSGNCSDSGSSDS